MNGLPIPRRYWAIAATSFGTMLASVGANIATVALPSIARDLHVTPAASVLVVTVYQVVLVMTLLPFSALGNTIGPRRLYQLGQWLFLLSTVACFLAPNLPLLLAARVVQAVGAGASMSVSTALMRAIYPTNRLGLGLAVGSVVVAVSNALAPSVGGLVLHVADWPYVFLMGAPLAIASLLLGRALPKIPPHAERYDMLGAVTYAVGFGLLIGGMEGVLQAHAPTVSVPLVAIGLVITTWFVRRELRSRVPILPVDLLRRPILALSMLGALLAFIGSMVLVLSLPFRLQHLYGLSPTTIGAVLMAWPLTVAAVAPLTGVLADRFSSAILGGAGMLCATLGMLLLAFVPATAHALDFAWRLGICGLGFGCYFVPNAQLIIQATPHHRVASAGGLMATNRYVGQTLGATFLAALLAFGLGNGPVPALIGGLLTFIAALCSMARLWHSAPHPPGLEK
jgi:DHA2 family multidrug resistance protein-like MFS transporter